MKLLIITLLMYEMHSISLNDIVLRPAPGTDPLSCGKAEFTW